MKIKSFIPFSLKNQIILVHLTKNPDIKQIFNVDFSSVGKI